MEPSGATELARAADEPRGRLISELAGEQSTGRRCLETSQSVSADNEKAVTDIISAPVEETEKGGRDKTGKQARQVADLTEGEPASELRARLARELDSKTTNPKSESKREAQAPAKARKGLLDALLGDRNWFEQKTVILDIDNSGKTQREQAELERKSDEERRQELGHDNEEAGEREHQQQQQQVEEIEEQEDGRSEVVSSGAARGKQAPTFGQTPTRVTRLPYYSYHGKARNVELVNAADRKPSSTEPDSNTSGGTVSSSGGPEGEIRARRHERQKRGYSNISNLFPGRPMQVRDSTHSRRASLDRSGSALGLHSQSASSLANRTRLASNQQRAARSPSSLHPSKIRSRSSEYSLADTSGRRQFAGSGVDMRRQNSVSGKTGRSQVGSTGYLAGANVRPASVQPRHQRSPSMGSLLYGPSGTSPAGTRRAAGLPIAAADDLYDPECPVHGYSPVNKAGYGKGGQLLGGAHSEADLLYEPYVGPAAPYYERRGPSMGSLYSPSSPPLLPAKAAGARAATPAYYNSPSRFSMYHSPGGQTTSLAPTGEQLRRILGYQPHTKPIHLHPQWAYSRPFIHLQSGARSPSPSQLDEYGDQLVRPQFAAYNQLADSQAVRAVDFHPNGEVYAVGSNSRALRICAYPADHELRHFSPESHITGAPRVLFKFLQVHRGSIYCVGFNATGQLLATGSNDQTVHLVRYNSATHSPDGDEFRLTMHDGTVRDLCFIDDHTSGATLLLSAGGGDNKIYVTDCDTVTPFQSMAGHTQMVMALHHWGGASFVSASYDRTIRIWDLRSRACTSILSAPPARGTGNKWAGPGAPVCSVRVDPSGRLLASGHSDSTCMLYDIRGARVIQAFKPHDDEIRTVSFSPKSYYLLTGGYDGRIVLSDLQGDLTQPLPSVCVAESDDKIVQSKWHPSDFTFVTTSADKTATLWALPSE